MRCPQARAAAAVVTISLNLRRPHASRRPVRDSTAVAWPTAPSKYTILPVQEPLDFRTISLRLSSYNPGPAPVRWSIPGRPSPGAHHRVVSLYPADHWQAGPPGARPGHCDGGGGHDHRAARPRAAGRALGVSPHTRGETEIPENSAVCAQPVSRCFSRAFSPGATWNNLMSFGLIIPVLLAWLRPLEWNSVISLGRMQTASAFAIHRWGVRRSCRSRISPEISMLPITRV